MLPLPLLAALLLLGACVSSPEPQVEIPEPPGQALPYSEALASATQRYEVIDTFKTRHHIAVTHVKPQLRQAFSERYRQVFNEEGSFFSISEGETAFIVSLYSANQNLGDLDNKKIWAIQLEAQGTSKEPLRIERLGPKEKVQAFLPQATLWSQEYLVVFSEDGAGSTLILSSPEGRVRASF